MSRSVLLVRHGDEPIDDRVFVYLEANGYMPVVRRAYAGDTLEFDAELAGCVIYGGPYNVFDTDLHPFLLDEYRLIDVCMKREIPLLGICQGAQMIAWHLGAAVGPTPSQDHEFGYYTVRPAVGAEDFLPGPIHVTQAHYHGFGLPDGAVLLASSDVFPHQAFRIGERIYGLQFHAEVTPDGMRRWQSRLGALYGKPGAQTRAEQHRLMELHDAAQAEWFEGFLRKLFPPGQLTPVSS